MTLVEELAAAGVSLELAGDRVRCQGPADALTPTIQAELRAQKPALLAFLRHRDAVGVLQGAVAEARDWLGLQAAIGEADAAFGRCELSSDDVCELTEAAIARSRSLPEGDP